jgi:hypothetical protein
MTKEDTAEWRDARVGQAARGSTQNNFYKNKKDVDGGGGIVFLPLLSFKAG